MGGLLGGGGGEGGGQRVCWPHSQIIGGLPLPPPPPLPTPMSKFTVTGNGYCTTDDSIDRHFVEYRNVRQHRWIYMGTGGFEI